MLFYMEKMIYLNIIKRNKKRTDLDVYHLDQFIYKHIISKTI